jgi:hypothetical protein
VELSLTSSAVASNIFGLLSGGKPTPELFANSPEGAAVQIHPEVLALKSRLMKRV